MVAVTGTVYASRGYRVLLARCRGTFGSGGTFEPMVHEVDDAADTVAWMRDQPWFDGRFATFGGSYLGFTQWALLVDPPPELAPPIISIGPHDFRAAAYQGGAFNLNDFLGWSNQVARQEDVGFVRGMLRGLGVGPRRSRTPWSGVPMVDAGEELLEGRAPWYREWIGRRDPGDPFWSPMMLDAALERVEVPVLLQTGWQDLFLQQTLEQYARLSGPRCRRCPHGRPVDPRRSGDEGRPRRRAGGARLACRAPGRKRRREHAPRRSRCSSPARASGAICRVAARPPNDRTLHLEPEGGLGDDPAPEGSAATFTYDPADPDADDRRAHPRARIGGYTDDGTLASA